MLISYEFPYPAFQPFPQTLCYRSLDYTLFTKSSILSLKLLSSLPSFTNSSNSHFVHSPHPFLKFFTSLKGHSACHNFLTFKFMHSSFNLYLCTVHTVTHHGELTGQLGKFVQYEINDLCLCRPGFYVPDISDSSRTGQKFVHFYTQQQPAD